MFQPREELKKFNYLYKEMDNVYHEMALRAGVSDSVFCVLYTLAERNSCSQKEIAASYSISRQTIHSAVKKLEKEGYIVLRAGTGRDKLLFLTPSGEHFMAERLMPIFQTENQVFQAMPPEESRELLRLTEKLIGLYREKFQEASRKNLSARKEKF